MQDIKKLLEEAQKLNKKKTPQELLAEAQEYIDGKKYGRKGKDGIDADEEKITQRVLAICLAQLPKKEDLKGEKGDTPTIDYKAIINAVVSQIKPIKGDKGDTPIVDYKSIVSQVTQAIKLPEIDLNSLSIDVVTMIESFEGDDKLDVLKLKNLDKLLSKIKEVEIDSSKIKGLQELINKIMPKEPPIYAGGSGATFLKSMRDVDLRGLTNGQVLKWNAEERKWLPSTDSDSQTLQQVTDNGSTTTNSITVPAIQFNTTATPLTNAGGLLQWNATDGTLDLGMSGGAITLQVGQEMFQKVRNVSGSTILNGKPVYTSGRTGNRPNIYLAKGDAEATSSVIGLTTQDITSPADGYVTTMGYVRGIKTDYTGTGIWGTTWVSGDKLWVSKAVAGQLTNVEPTAPHHSDVVATVEIVHSSLGSLLVNIDRHKTLQELADVNGTPLAKDGQFPVWHNTAGYFDFDKNINDYLKLDQTTPQTTVGTFTFPKVTAGVVTATDSIETAVASLGSTKIRNGNFSTTISAADWTKGPGWTQTGGKMVCGSNNAGNVTQTSAQMLSPLVVGEWYTLSFTLSSYTAGLLSVSIGGKNFTALNANRTFSESFKCTATTQLQFTPSTAARLSIDDVVLVKVSGVLFGGAIVSTGSVGTQLVEGPGTRFLWSPNKQSLRFGVVSGNQWDNFQTGTSSFAGGNNSIASGFASFSFGVSTNASNSYAMAFGTNSQASGQYSFAQGNVAVASNTNAFSSGSATLSAGIYSTSFGRNAKSYGQGALALGTVMDGALITAGTGVADTGYGQVAMGYATAGDGIVLTIDPNVSGADFADVTDQLTLDGGNADAIVEVATLKTIGKIDTYSLNNGGTGYKVNEIGHVNTGSFDAYYMVDAVDGEIGGIESYGINYGGEGYVVNDVVTVDGGNYDATFEVMSVDGAFGGIASYGIYDGGLGYAIGDYIYVDGGTSTATFGVIDVDGSGTVISLEQLDAGAGYYNDNFVTSTNGSGYGFMMTVSSTFVGAITALTLWTNGSGYGTGTWGVTGGTGANATIDVTDIFDGIITAVQITEPGTGYVTGNGIATQASEGSGSGLTIDIITIIGQIDTVTLITGGTGYQALATYPIGGLDTSVTVLTTSRLGAVTAEGTGSVAIGEDVEALTNPNIFTFGKRLSVSTEQSFNVGFNSTYSTTPAFQVISDIVNLTVPLKFTSASLLSSPVAGVVEFLTDKFYATQTTATTRKEIKLVDQYYAEMYEYENTNATTIGTQNVYHAVNDLVAGSLNGFTFVSGIEGTIASVANYNGTVAGTILITDVAHGLATGDIITIHSTTNYNGTYTITKVTNDTFYVTKAYVSSQTGDWAMGAYLRCSTGSDGVYRLTFNNTSLPASNNETFKFELNKNTTPLDNIANSNKYGTAGDYKSMSASGLASLVAGDRIWLSTRNETSGADITVRHANINITRL